MIEPRIFANLTDDHKIVFPCRCGEMMTMPAWGADEIVHGCGLAWRWTDTHTLAWRDTHGGDAVVKPSTVC